MKQTLILLILSGMSVVLPAQNNDRFSGTLKELFLLMQAKHNVRFMYGNDDIDDSRTVSLEINPELKVVMNNVSKLTGVVYEMVNNQVVLRGVLIDNGQLKIEDKELDIEDEELDIEDEKLETEDEVLEIEDEELEIEKLSIINPPSSISNPSFSIIKTKISFPEIFGNEPSMKIKTREISLHTNLLYDLMLTPNVGFGYKTNETFELLLNGAWSQLKWNSQSRTFRLRMVNGEFRVYPFGNKRYYFGGIYHTGATNIKFGENGYQGYFMGGGISTGYIREVNRNFSIDFGLGFGCVWFDYESYTFAGGTNLRKDSRTEHFWLPIKANVGLVWKIRTSKKLRAN